jgi:hypothetical protein
LSTAQDFIAKLCHSFTYSLIYFFFWGGGDWRMFLQQTCATAFFVNWPRFLQQNCATALNTRIFFSFYLSTGQDKS